MQENEETQKETASPVWTQPETQCMDGILRQMETRTPRVEEGVQNIQGSIEGGEIQLYPNQSWGLMLISCIGLALTRILRRYIQRYQDREFQ